ncbi:MAG TPA: CinA family protein [Opitutaceae bacterium]
MPEPADLKSLMTASPALTLAVAESLTSGRLQARIGEVSGASTFFLGGVTAYSLEQKVGLLGVSRREAMKVNCVSASIARQMARGVRRLFGSDIGVATTGYAEPSGDWKVAVPFAWWAVSLRPGGGKALLVSGKVSCPGLSRVQVQERAAQAAYDALLKALRATAARRRK